jgi:hypothetical protein
MSNLYNQNIGQNYRGILNLDATTINTPLNATLRAVTDGTGTSSVLNLSTTQVNIGGGSSLGRLTVRGDGTNPIARFENSGGVNSLSINNDGSYHQYGSNGSVGMFITNQNGSQSISGGALNWYSNLSALAGFGFRLVANNILAYTSGTGGLLEIGSLGGTFSASAGSGNFRPLSLAYTINNSGVQTGNATGIFLNATETALNGITHNLMDLQVGGVSKARIGNDGSYNMAGSNFGLILNNGSVNYLRIAYTGTDARIDSNGIVFANISGAAFTGLLKIGGTTNLFPAIGRSGSELSSILADGSAFTAINASIFRVGGSSTQLQINQLNLAGFNTIQFSTRMYIDGDNKGVAINNNLAIGGGNIATNSTSVLELISTTKGFLPPRQTTTQINAIVSPAEGLQIYNTTINHMCFYMNGAWQKINHSPM